MGTSWLHSSFKRLAASFILAFALVTAMAQVDVVMIYGTVKDMTSSKKLDGVIITVFKNGAKLVDVPTNASGKYEVNLDYGADYKIMCSKSGYVGKNITIDTRNIPEEDRQGGHGMNIDFTMMVSIPDVDFSILQEAFGKAKYQAASNNFEWDMEYTAKMKDAQARLLKEYDERKKRELNAEADFVKKMAEGNAALTASDFK
ncbi:MAG TPA: carboxypeptidase-like regulatory domain-containing protein, partial [Flavobacteriales bacterium]|nr:carboxypeptidase-like regulatory domain-containing protein [Flavobacteriales bacterium]